MDAKITGMVIDQTRTEGKWYVRELKDGNGGVRPLFFRREKSDLIGRLIDKFTHVESAQRYAARHMKDLGFDSNESMTDVYSRPGELNHFGDKQQKLASERLQRLLAGKMALASAGDANTAPQEAQADIEAAPPVTVIHNKDVPTEQLDRLWNACRHPRYADRQDRNARKDFDQQMGQALQLCSGELATNDPAVWRECREFISHLGKAGQSAWAGDAARLEFGQLRDYFFPTLPAAPATTGMSADEAALEAGKMGFALVRLFDDAKFFTRPELRNDLHQSLAHLLQIGLEEHATPQALEAVFLPWPRITTSQDKAELADLLELAKGLHRPPRNDDRVLLDKTIAAIGMRLARIDGA